MIVASACGSHGYSFFDGSTMNIVSYEGGGAYTYSGHKFRALHTCGPCSSVEHDSIMAKWCYDNCEGLFGPGFTYFYFELEQDALMFLMRFA